MMKDEGPYSAGSKMRKRFTAALMINLVLWTVQIGVSCAIIGIVRHNLANVTFISGPNFVTYVYSCTMADSSSFPGACNYAYSLASVSVFWVFMLSIFQCCVMDPFGKGRVLEACWAMIAVFWWLAGAIVLTVYGQNANDIGVPDSNYRNAVIALCWTSFALFVLLLGSNLVMLKIKGASAKSYADDRQPPVATPYMPAATPYAPAATPYVPAATPYMPAAMPQGSPVPTSFPSQGPPVGASAV